MAGLSERGVGVAVPIVQGRILAGLWVWPPPQGPGLHRRRALGTLDRLSRQIAPRLGAALAGDPRR